MSSVVDIALLRGNDEKINVTMKDADGGAIIMTGGDELYFTVKKAALGCEEIEDGLIFQKSLSKGIENNNDGTYTVNIAAVDTDDLKGLFAYDLKCVFALGNDEYFRKTALMGMIDFRDTRTRIDEEGE
ncbi:MAG: hypothetical protein WC292_00390 [Clostridia bacterium]